MTGPTLASIAAAYAAGATVASVVETALDHLSAGRSSAVLIDGPLVERARADVARLRDVDPATKPLYGVPFVVKDNIDVAGVPTTAACPSFAYRPTADATVVARLRAAGAVVVGKANLDQFATGLVGTRSPYGTPLNTTDPSLVPGGSSSGSAVAVASGAVAFALGTDTAGSGRVPAAFNRIVGLKPTRGRLSTAGVVPAVQRFDCVSVFARSVADAAAVAAVAAGPDRLDPFSREGLAPIGVIGTVGVPERWDEDSRLTGSARRAFADDLVRLTDLGVTVVPIDAAALWEAGSLLYGGPLVGERHAAVGHVLDGRDDLDPSVASIIAASTRWTAADAYRAEYRLAALRAEVDRWWAGIDAIALPTTPFVPTLVDVAADPLGVNARLGQFTTFVNVLDLAALVVPSRAGGPYGMQLIGPAWSDERLVELGTAVASGTRPPSPPRGHVLAVVGAHLRGQPLNVQLTSIGAVFRAQTTTAPAYKLFALRGTVPPKPGLERVADGGAAIEVELWELPRPAVSGFLAGVPAPLCIGSIELADGSWCQGFLCEPIGLADAVDITAYGGWRGYRAAVG